MRLSLVKQLVEWGCGCFDGKGERREFLELFEERVKLALQETERKTAITYLVSFLRLAQDEWTGKKAAELLGTIGSGDSTAIDTLVKLLETTDEEDIRETAARACGELTQATPLLLVPGCNSWKLRLTALVTVYIQVPARQLQRACGKLAREIPPSLKLWCKNY